MRNSREVATPEMERALALRDVVDHAARLQKEITDVRPIAQSHFKRIAVAAICVPLLALCVYSWVARPAAIWGPGQAQASAGLLEAEARFATVRLAQRITAFRASNGYYPESLVALGGDNSAFAYTIRADSVFVLTTSVNGKAIVYHSTEAPLAFLGNSVAVLQGGR